jgi:hypothetical protein
MRRIMIRVTPVKKFKKPHLNQWLGTVVHACYPSYARKHCCLGCLKNIKADPVSKATNSKRGSGVALVVESALQASGPEFKLQYCQKKKKKLVKTIINSSILEKAKCYAKKLSEFKIYFSYR